MANKKTEVKLLDVSELDLSQKLDISSQLIIELNQGNPGGCLELLANLTANFLVTAAQSAKDCPEYDGTFLKFTEEVAGIIDKGRAQAESIITKERH